MRTRGLFGGTFDPPHLGHVAAARAAIEALGLDELVVTVAKDPQLKDAPPAAPPELRLEMTEAAFADVEGAVVLDLELRRDGPTYTVDTVRALIEDRPEDALILVVGADAAAALPRWHEAAELARLVPVAVVPRPGAGAVVAPGFRLVEVEMPPVDLASTSVRQALAAGADPAGLVPAAVVPVLLRNRLYSP